MKIKFLQNQELTCLLNQTFFERNSGSSPGKLIYRKITIDFQ